MNREFIRQVEAQREKEWLEKNKASHNGKTPEVKRAKYTYDSPAAPAVIVYPIQETVSKEDKKEWYGKLSENEIALPMGKFYSNGANKEQESKQDKKEETKKPETLNEAALARFGKELAEKHWSMRPKEVWQKNLWIIRKMLTWSEMYIIESLWSYEGDNGAIFPTNDTLADDLGISQPNINRAISKLKLPEVLSCPLCDHKSHAIEVGKHDNAIKFDNSTYEPRGIESFVLHLYYHMINDTEEYEALRESYREENKKKYKSNFTNA